MKRVFFALAMVLSIVVQVNSQDINNTLGSSGTFTIKDGSTTFFSLTQSNGNVSLNNVLTLPVTTSSSIGVIFKGTDRFIHDYQAGATGYNTFVGVESGNFTMSATANFNTAVGHISLKSLTTGSANSAFGRGSLYANTTGLGNAAFGYSSLFNNTEGVYNAAFGSTSLYSNSTGNSNSAFGYLSLYSVTGNNNAAFGYSAGSNLTTGSNNTLLGYNAQPSGATVSNEIVLGDANIQYLRCAQNSISALSDARDKRNIRDLSLGLDFLMRVRPRLYNWDRREWYKNGRPDGSKMKQEPTAGFIAQELDQAQTDADAQWLNLVLKSNPERLEATPGNLLPIMVKAIQELKAENDNLRHEITTLRRTIADEVRTALQNEQTEKTKVSFNRPEDRP